MFCHQTAVKVYMVCGKAFSSAGIGKLVRGDGKMGLAKYAAVVEGNLSEAEKASRLAGSTALNVVWRCAELLRK